MDIEEFKREYAEASRRYHEMSATARTLHNDNLTRARDMYPKIKKAIAERLFDRGMCLPGVWEHRNMGPGTGGHYELTKLLEPRDLEPDERSPGPIRTAEELDRSWVKEQVLNRYFDRYMPRVGLLYKELGIDIR